MKFNNHSNKSIMLDQHKTLSVMLLWAGREFKTGDFISYHLDCSRNDSACVYKILTTGHSVVSPITAVGVWHPGSECGSVKFEQVNLLPTFPTLVNCDITICEAKPVLAAHHKYSSFKIFGQEYQCLGVQRHKLLTAKDFLKGDVFVDRASFIIKGRVVAL